MDLRGLDALGRGGNLKSCRELPQVITEKIGVELALGRIQGPFDKPPFQNLQVSPIGCVPKKKPGEYPYHPPFKLS